MKDWLKIFRQSPGHSAFFSDPAAEMRHVHTSHSTERSDLLLGIIGLGVFACSIPLLISHDGIYFPCLGSVIPLLICIKQSDSHISSKHRR